MATPNLRRIQREFQECQEFKDDLPHVESIDRLSDYVWRVTIRGQQGCLKITFPPDYPFHPPSLEADGAEEVQSPLRNLVGCRKTWVEEDEWSPALTIFKILSPAPDHHDAFDNAAFRNITDILPHGSVVYLSIGCGGPVIRQKYPPLIQAHFRQQRKQQRLVLILVDPLLGTWGGSIPKPKGDDGVGRLDGDGFTVFFIERALRRQNMDELLKAVQVWTAKKDRDCIVYLKDHRNGTFDGPVFPIIMPTSTRDVNSGGQLEVDGVVEALANSILSKADAKTMLEDPVLLNYEGLMTDALRKWTATIYGCGALLSDNDHESVRNDCKRIMEMDGGYETKTLRGLRHWEGQTNDRGRHIRWE